MKSLIEKLRELKDRLLGNLGAAAGVAAAAAALALVLPTPALAGSPQRIPLLSDGITSLTVSNTLPYTNILSPASFGTNIVGLQWTTLNGTPPTNLTVVATSSNGTVTKLTRSASLWSDPTGYCPTNTCLSLTFFCGAGNSGTTNFIDFVPLYNGTNESTEAGDVFRWVFTSAGAVTNTIHTNNPISRWPGAQRVRVREILSGTNAAASQVVIQDLSLNGFPP